MNRRFSQVDWQEATKVLQAGGVGVIPTDTVYGLAARAEDSAAVKRLYALKSRERKPGTIIAASFEQLADFGFAAEDLAAAAKFWPNPVSVVLKIGEGRGYLHLGLDSLAVRIPADEGLRSFVEETGLLLTSSANAPGETEATTVEEAYKYFGEEVDFYVDGGIFSGRTSSTVVRIGNDKNIEILRQGFVDIANLMHDFS